MSLDRAEQVAVVSVGDELLAGAHPDLNGPFLAGQMALHGRSVRRVLVVGDDEADIAGAVDLAAREAGLVFVTGGLGPTLDDVTRHGVARSVGAPLVESAEAWAEVRGWFERAGREILDSNRRQALLPEGAERVPNAFGTAPGFRAIHPSGAAVIVLPGPPRELQGVFVAEVEPWLREHPVGTLARARAVACFADLPESTFAERVGDWMARDANPLIGVTAKEGILTARCVGRDEDPAEALRLAEARAAELAALFPDQHLGGEVEDFGAFVGAQLVARGETFAVAESCTGGAVAGAVTAAPGVSAVFRGSFVTYADDWKESALGVPGSILQEHGAVSRACAEAMARGALLEADVQLAVSVTGIAGPDGGTDDKPVGLVWFGVARRGADGHVTTRAVERRWPPLGRARVRRWARNKALSLLLRPDAI